jgi:hypothetical protein
MDGWVQSKNVKCDAGKKSLIILDIQKQYFYSLAYKNNLLLTYGSVSDKKRYYQRTI